MDNPPLVPISGEHFEDFLLLTQAEQKKSKITRAWQVLQQQTQAYVPSTSTLDLNRICVDVIRIELLVFPVVEDWKRPLTDKEWSQVEKESEQLKEQMERMRKLSILVRKKDPSAFPDVAPLFNKLFVQNKELCKDWQDFKNAWASYKQQWKLFQARKERAEKRKQQPKARSETADSNATKKQSSPQDDQPPVPPPMFLRDRWHALRVCSQALEAELSERCKRFRSDAECSPEVSAEEKTQPAPDVPATVLFLVEELRKIYLKIRGFELIEKVQLVQERNAQLMQELQPYFPQPIISAEMLKDTESSPKPSGEPSAVKKNPKPATTKSYRKFFFIGALFLLGILAVIFWQNPGPPPEKEGLKRLKFYPKNKTITAKSPETNQLPEVSLSDMLGGFNLDVPVAQSNERLKKLVSASPETMENLANNILAEMGENAVFAFAEAQSFFLFWKGELQKFTSPQEMKKMLNGLESEYKKVESFWRGMGDKAPENAKLVPEVLNGEPTYALEMLDENGEPMQVYMTEEGVRLRLSNGEFLDKPLTPQEAMRQINLR